MLEKQADLESPYSHVIKVLIYLIEHLLVPIKICFQDLPLSYGHRQQGIQGPRNPTASHEPSLKGPSELLEGANRTFFQTVESSYRHEPQTGWEHFAYQGFIPGVNGHSLVEVADVLHKVRSAIIHGECWLSKMLRKLSPFNSMHKR